MSSSGYFAIALGSGAVSVKANFPALMASNTPIMIGTLIMLAVGKVSSAWTAAVAPVAEVADVDADLAVEARDRRLDLVLQAPSPDARAVRRRARPGRGGAATANHRGTDGTANRGEAMFYPVSLSRPPISVR